MLKNVKILVNTNKNPKMVMPVNICEVICRTTDLILLQSLCGWTCVAAAVEHNGKIFCPVLQQGGGRESTARTRQLGHHWGESL